MHPYKKLMLVLAVITIALLSSVATATVIFEQAEACLTTSTGEHRLQVEVAKNNQQRARGLMERTELGDYQGMVFIYPSAAVRGFWMFQTRIALDIAYMNAAGQVLETLQMTPCRSRRSFECPSYLANMPFTMALEMAAGRFAALEVTTGSLFKFGTCPLPE